MPIESIDPPPFVSAWRIVLNDGLAKYNLRRRPELVMVNIGDYKEYAEWFRRAHPDLNHLSPMFKGILVAVDSDMAPGECTILWGEDSNAGKS